MTRPRSTPAPKQPAVATKRYRLQVATWMVVREPGQAPLPRVLSSPEATAEVVIEWFKVNDDDREHFLVLLLNAQNRLLLVHTVSLGTQSASLVHPREVFGPALREGAASILLAHNHPSGDPTPSREDLALTRQLADAGKLLNVPVHDHLVVGSGTWRWVSLAQRGAL